MVDFGCDFDSSFELISPGGHFKTVEGTDNAIQAVKTSLTTLPSDLEILNYSESGNNAYKCLGLTDVDLAKSLIQLYTIEKLLKTPVVKEVKEVIVSEYGNDTCIVDIGLVLVNDEDEEDTIESIRIDIQNPEEIL